MKRLVVAIVIGLFSLSAHAVDFYDYGCQFVKFGNGGEWTFFGVTANSLYQKSLGANSETSATNYYTKFADGSQLGVCAESVTMGPDLWLKVHFVDGKDLDFGPSGCAFQGREVRYTTTGSLAPSVDHHLSAFRERQVGNETRGELVIIATRSQRVIPDHLFDMCTSLFEKDFGHKPAVSRPGVSTLPTVKYKAEYGRSLHRGN